MKPTPSPLRLFSAIMLSVLQVFNLLPNYWLQSNVIPLSLGGCWCCQRHMNTIRAGVTHVYQSQVILCQSLSTGMYTCNEHKRNSADMWRCTCAASSASMLTKQSIVNGGPGIVSWVINATIILEHYHTMFKGNACDPTNPDLSPWSQMLCDSLTIVCWHW